MNALWLWILSLSWLTQVWAGYGLLSATLIAFAVISDHKNPKNGSPTSIIMMFVGAATLVIYSLVHYWQWFQLMN